MSADTELGAKDAPQPEVVPEPTLGEVLQAKLKQVEADLQAKAQEVTDLRAKISAIPAHFHGFSLKQMAAEVEAWFKGI